MIIIRRINPWLAILITLLILFSVSAIVILVPSVKNRVFVNKKVEGYSLNNIIAAVVSVYCPKVGDPKVAGYWGSGTIWGEDGTIYTNAHVIPKDGTTIMIPESGCLVTLPDPNDGSPTDTYLAKPAFAFSSDLENKYDFTELKIYAPYIDENGKTHGKYPRTFPGLSIIGETCPNQFKDNPVELGERIRILGYPGASGNESITITEGIVSNLPDDGETILTSAKIDSGNSGGLAVDSNNCPIGIPSAVSIGQYDNLGVIHKQYAIFAAQGKIWDQQYQQRNK